MDGSFERGATVGSYRILRAVGNGGMGSVYEAEHVRLGTRYALKVFRFEGTNREFLRKRFLAEAKVLARLDNPRIVRVYDMDVEESFAWFTMNYVEGTDGVLRTLADVPQAGRTPTDRIVGWYEDVRAALTAVHAAGVVHRDVKLENVLLARDGHAVLADFGICRILDDRLRGEVNVTRTMASKDEDMKVVLGTAAYLAPEIRAEGEATAATDLYALGVAFFRLLTGLWYEPGPHAFDLLAPFDRRWKTVLAALLAENPSERSALPFRVAVRRRCLWPLVGMVASAVAASVLTALFIRLRQPSAQVPSVQESADVAEKGDVSVEEVFSIPDSIK